MNGQLHLDWVVLVFEAILRMGCSKLGCKISTLGALSAGKTEAPPGSKMFLEMDISYHFMSYVCDYIRIYCALYCVRTFFVYGCVRMTRLRDVLGCACIFTPWVDVRKSKCYQHIRPDFQGESVGTCRQCLYLVTLLDKWFSLVAIVALHEELDDQWSQAQLDTCQKKYPKNSSK